MGDVHGSQQAAIPISPGDVKCSPDGLWTHGVSSIIGQPYSRTSSKSASSFCEEPFTFVPGDLDRFIHLFLSGWGSVATSIFTDVFA